MTRVLASVAAMAKGVEAAGHSAGMGDGGRHSGRIS